MSIERNSRDYCQSHEAQQWDIQPVYEFMAATVWTQRVDKVGRISLLSTACSVGRVFAGHDVTILFDADTGEWVIEDEQGQCLKRYASREITPERILNLNLAKRANSVSDAAS